jgi:hypothetical protein
VSLRDPALPRIVRHFGAGPFYAQNRFAGMYMRQPGTRAHIPDTWLRCGDFSARGLFPTRIGSRDAAARSRVSGHAARHRPVVRGLKCHQKHSGFCGVREARQSDSARHAEIWGCRSAIVSTLRDRVPEAENSAARGFRVAGRGRWSLALGGAGVSRSRMGRACRPKIWSKRRAEVPMTTTLLVETMIGATIGPRHLSALHPGGDDRRDGPTTRGPVHDNLRNLTKMRRWAIRNGISANTRRRPGKRPASIPGPRLAGSR